MQRFFYICILLASLICFREAGATTRQVHSHTNLQPEELHYKVMFKWGMINKQAGSAVLTLKHGPMTYEAQLTAKSAPWADRIYCVRDTLNGRMSYNNFMPLFYEKIAHESTDYKHDTVVYDYTDAGLVQAHCTRYVEKKGVNTVDERKTMSSSGLAFDMLTSYYFMRTLPFDSWHNGHVETADIFSGKQKEVLSIVYNGKESVEIDGKKRPAYHVTFKFTSGGGKKTSDDMDAWIAADSSRIPLKLEGKLPVGKVHCLYVPK